MTSSEHPDPLQRLADLIAAHGWLQRRYDRLPPRTAARRNTLQELRRTVERFERNLHHWIAGAPAREAWLACFHRGATLPSVPRLERPPLIFGRTRADESFELLPAEDQDGYDIFVGGHCVAHVDSIGDLTPGAAGRFRVGDWTVSETFCACSSAIEALVAHDRADPGTSPPWAWALELYEDGLIDADFSLTHRGRRLVRSRAHTDRDRHMALRTHA